MKELHTEIDILFNRTKEMVMSLPSKQKAGLLLYIAQFTFYTPMLYR